MKTFNEPSSDSSTEFIVGSHSVGDWGHGIGPSIAFFNPGRLKYDIRPTNLFSIELFAYTPAAALGREEGAHPAGGRCDRDDARSRVGVPSESADSAGAVAIHKRRMRSYRGRRTSQGLPGVGPRYAASRSGV